MIYQPAAGFKGIDTFWYAYTYSLGIYSTTNAAKVTVYVHSPESGVGEKPPEWPTAVNDYASTGENNIITIPVLENDLGGGLTLTSVNDWTAKGGRAYINEDNKTISYQRTPLTLQDTDSFWYEFTDAWGRTNSAKVTIVFDTPISQSWAAAEPDNISILMNIPVKIDVLANDFGVVKELKLVDKSSVKWGTVTIQDNRAYYSPRYGFTGVDEFWYVMENLYGKLDSNKVTINVLDANEVVETGKLNDTGVILCADLPASIDGNGDSDLTNCYGSDAHGDYIPPKQDATHGRDVTHNDGRDGYAGFSFTKLNALGQPLAADAPSWSCVKDNVTGLIWEKKEGKWEGIGGAGLHSADDKFSWYNSDSSQNGGDYAGMQQEANSQTCYGLERERPDTYCNTEAFVQRVNSAALCGITTWRLPSLPELDSIVSYDGRIPTIDSAYFPNTALGLYSTSSMGNENVKAVAFYAGHTEKIRTHEDNSFVRLVSEAIAPSTSQQ